MARIQPFDQFQAMRTALERKIRVAREGYDLGLPLFHLFVSPQPVHDT